VIQFARGKSDILSKLDGTYEEVKKKRDAEKGNKSKFGLFHYRSFFFPSLIIHYIHFPPATPCTLIICFINQY